MKKKLAVLVIALLGLSGMLTTVEAIRLNIEVGDQGFYTRGAGYWDHGVYYVWIPGHWAWHHGNRFWVHGHYRIR